MANFKGPQYNYIVAADTVVAADIVLDNGILSFGVPLATALRPICDFQDLIPGACDVQIAVTEVLQITTVTFTATANTEYYLRIEQWDPVRQVMMFIPISYTSLPAGDTATTIGDVFRAAITANRHIEIAATGGATLILTAEAGYPTFTVFSISPADTTQATGTAGVIGVNTTAALELQGIEGVAAASEYTRVHLVFNANGTPMNSLQANQPYVLDIFVDEASANYATVLAKWQFTLMGRLTSVGGPANPDALAVI